MTKIEWCDEVWNPITGCSPASEGCQNCYAKRMAQRLKGRYGYPKDDPFQVTFHLDRLDQPSRWRNPRRIFVCSMGDLFHEDVKDDWINDVFSTMTGNFYGACHHTYLILTKRPERILRGHAERFAEWKNIWLGVSVENQQRADERIPILLQIPAAVRFVSLEPMLGPVDIGRYLLDVDGLDISGGWPQSAGLNWVIMGAESGPRARPMKYDWAFDVAEQCQTTGTPLFYKQGIDDDGNRCKMPKLQGLTRNEFPKV